MKPGGFGGVTYTPDGYAHRSYEISSTATTGTIGLQWTPDKDTMAYGRYGRGYLQGGINSGVTSSLGQFPYTAPEYINNYEIGIKKDFGRKLQTNIAIFYYDFSDYQVPLTVANLTGGLAVSQSRYVNVPKSVSEGIEIETVWNPIDNLRILFNYSYNPSRIDQLTNIIDPADPEALQPGAKPVTPGAVATCTGTGSTVTATFATCGYFARRSSSIRARVAFQRIPECVVRPTVTAIASGPATTDRTCPISVSGRPDSGSATPASKAMTPALSADVMVWPPVMRSGHPSPRRPRPPPAAFPRCCRRPGWRRRTGCAAAG